MHKVFQILFPDTKSECIRYIHSPYRICPVGAHIDHQHGHVTGFAIDHGVDFLYVPTEAGIINLFSENFEGQVLFSLDNVIDFSFAPFVEFASRKGTSCISYHIEPSVAALQKTGVLETDESFRVLAMHEKPQNPPSNYAVPPFYYYRAADLPLLIKSMEEGCGFDAPGNLASWLCKQTEMYAWQLTGNRYDIGDLSSYESVCKLFAVKE